MEILELLRRFRRLFDGYFSYKKVLLIVILFSILMYVWPFIFRLFSNRKVVIADVTQDCLDLNVQPFRQDLDNFDAYIHYESLENDQPFLPYIGNGKIGLSPDGTGNVYIKHARALSLTVHFHPVINVNIKGTDKREATVTEYKSGLIHRLQCFRRGSECIEIKNIYYAHRTRPSVLVQDIWIHNPTDDTEILMVHQTGPFDWQGSSTEILSVEPKAGEKKDYYLISGTINVPGSKNVVVAVVATLKMPSSIEVHAKLSVNYHVVSVVQHSIPVDLSKYDDQKKVLEEEVKAEMQTIMTIEEKKLKQEHVKIWKQIWEPGFSISYSKAAGALNGDKINATIYAVLSSTRAPLHEVDITPEKQKDLISMLTRPDHCYSNHHTLQASTLWSDLKSEDDIAKVASLWQLTLQKQGCRYLLQAGSDGVIQAMLLSFGGFTFSNHHLEFNTQPSDLHRDYNFRRIRYGNDNYINISVIVGEDNKALLYSSVDRKDQTFYACDGGCLDAPVELSQEIKQFPVKRTNPLTAILYITPDKEHIEELKHAIHVKEVVEAPAHEHHVIALHRHGHHLGGLPILFWVSIALLVAIFHLFLFKLIYNEYCGGGQDRFRDRYNV